MKITVRQLRRVIAEEVQRVLESSKYQQGHVYNNPDLDSREIDSIKLSEYSWQLDDEEVDPQRRVGGTLKPTAESGMILLQIMTTNQDKNIKVNAIGPGGRKI